MFSLLWEVGVCLLSLPAIHFSSYSASSKKALFPQLPHGTSPSSVYNGGSYRSISSVVKEVFFFGILQVTEARKRLSETATTLAEARLTGLAFLWPHERMLSGLALLLLACLHIHVQGKLWTQVGEASPLFGPGGTWETLGIFTDVNEH